MKAISVLTDKQLDAIRESDGVVGVNWLKTKNPVFART